MLLAGPQVNVLLSSSSHLNRLGLALMQILEMDASQLSIIQEQSQGTLLLPSFWKGKDACVSWSKTK